MRIPRQVPGAEVAKALRELGYDRMRQDGSHIRLTTTVNGTHHVTIPNHKPLKLDTLWGGVQKPVAANHGLTVEELLAKISL